MSQFTSAAIDAAMNKSKISGAQYSIAVLCALLLVFDGYDLGAIGYAIPALSADWNVAPKMLTEALVLGGVGMLFGSLISGPIGDRYGRKKVLIVCGLLFGISTLGSALADTVRMLAVTRFVAGLGLGGCLPAAVTLTSDYLPKNKRALFAGAVTAAIPLGLMLGGLLATKLIPAYGWRSIFVVGGVAPLALLPFMIFMLPESLHVMIARGGSDTKISALLRRMNITVDAGIHEAEIAKTPPSDNLVRQLFARGYAKRTLLLWTIFFGNLLSSWLVIFWLPTILNSLGTTPQDAAFYSSMLPMGGLIGIVVVFIIGPILGLELCLSLGLFIGVAAILLLWGTTSVSFLAGLLIGITGAGIQSAQFGMNGLSGAVYPPQFRATGSGWAFGIGRLGTIVGPAIGGLVLGMASGPKAMLLVAVIPFLAAGIAAALLANERRLGRLE